MKDLKFIEIKKLIMWRMWICRIDREGFRDLHFKILHNIFLKIIYIHT